MTSPHDFYKLLVYALGCAFNKSFVEYTCVMLIKLFSSLALLITPNLL